MLRSSRITMYKSQSDMQQWTYRHTGSILHEKHSVSSFWSLKTTKTVATETTTGSTHVYPESRTVETNKRMGGLFAAGLFTGFGTAAVIAGVVYFLYIRRRCVIKKPHPDSGPASLTHPTYSGLTGLGCPDTYDVIYRPEGVTSTSEQSQAPDYQNVNDVS